MQEVKKFMNKEEKKGKHKTTRNDIEPTAYIIVLVIYILIVIFWYLNRFR
jgi:hypothetical protein